MEGMKLTRLVCTIRSGLYRFLEVSLGEFAGYSINSQRRRADGRGSNLQRPVGCVIETIGKAGCITVRRGGLVPAEAIRLLILPICVDAV